MVPPAMRAWIMLLAIVSWPFAVWHTFLARRRLRADARLLEPGPERLTLRRVA
jgi:hypothetical protein